MNKLIEEHNSRIFSQFILLFIANVIIFSIAAIMKPSTDVSYASIVLMAMFDLWYIRNME